MSDEPRRITIIAETFSAAALEFHRGHMAERGYRMEGRIAPTVFQRLEGEATSPETVFDGKPQFAVTFVKRDEDD